MLSIFGKEKVEMLLKMQILNSTSNVDGESKTWKYISGDLGVPSSTLLGI